MLRKITIYDIGPSANNVVLNWHDRPQKVLFLSKPTPEVLEYCEPALKYLWEKNLEVVVEESLYKYIKEKALMPDNVDSNIMGRKSLDLFDSNDVSIDFVITFGGDGLLLHCNTLFSNDRVPPIIGFDFGSLGFLSPFPYDDFEREIDRLLEGSILLTLRMRLECSIWKGDDVEMVKYSVLNEAVIDRGPSSFLSVLDLTCDSQYLTTVQGDGIIISTPTGSTAYSLAAGGSIVSPSVAAILLTPVCAHTLSFRPMLLPDSAVLTCAVPEECRASGWVSFDGKFRQELKKGHQLRIRMCPYPMPTINRLNYTGDWFDSLRASFMFNLRPRQKSN